MTVIHKAPYIADAAATAILIAGEKDYQQVTRSMGVDKYLVASNDHYKISQELELYLIL